MKRVLLYSVLLIVGLLGSQFMPDFFSVGRLRIVQESVRILTMAALSFIMIHVGYEFDFDKSKIRGYIVDYGIAATAAAFPWIFCAGYFVFAFNPPSEWWIFDSWKDALLAGRFAAPTSAGILFSMLAATGLASTWYFRKIRILAIFDDLDTVLFMIPLKMLIVGLKWQLGVVVFVMFFLLWFGWKNLHRIQISIRWPSVLLYSALITLISELIYKYSKFVDDVVPIHIEVLLPAFILGCVISRKGNKGSEGECVLELPEEKQVSTRVSSVFMVLVGLSMPVIQLEAGMTPESLFWHVVVVTLLANLGKMFPLFCYKEEASFKERLALCVGMWPRGEVGAGVLILSLSYGIGGPMLSVAVLSLALNLLLTGVFIYTVKKLLSTSHA